ncbi:MAG: hypothetical protein ACO3FE_23490 [Planctomycetaceae bacterium]
MTLFACNYTLLRAEGGGICESSLGFGPAKGLMRTASVQTGVVSERLSGTCMVITILQITAVTGNTSITSAARQ